MIFGRFPFADSPDTAVITCHHVLEGSPILRVTHDADDGMWQFLCGHVHETDEARVISLQEALTLDASPAKHITHTRTTARILLKFMVCFSFLNFCYILLIPIISEVSIFGN